MSSTCLKELPVLINACISFSYGFYLGSIRLDVKQNQMAEDLQSI